MKNKKGLIVATLVSILIVLAAISAYLKFSEEKEDDKGSQETTSSVSNTEQTSISPTTVSPVEETKGTTIDDESSDLPQNIDFTNQEEVEKAQEKIIKKSMVNLDKDKKLASDNLRSKIVDCMDLSLAYKVESGQNAGNIGPTYLCNMDAEKMPGDMSPSMEIVNSDPQIDQILENSKEMTREGDKIYYKIDLRNTPGIGSAIAVREGSVLHIFSFKESTPNIDSVKQVMG